LRAQIEPDLGEGLGIGVGASADAVLRFEHEYVGAVTQRGACRCNPGTACPNDNDVVRRCRRR
jgi:hypothetical protein